MPDDEFATESATSSETLLEQFADQFAAILEQLQRQFFVRDVPLFMVDAQTVANLV